jgi:small subunit ribosomal protein S6
MIIFDADLEEETIRAAVDRFFQLIQSKGAEPGHVDYWGKRRFAYEINKKEEGYYVFFNVVAPPGSLDELERHLRLADEVVRHKLIRLPDHEAARRGMVEQQAG